MTYILKTENILAYLKLPIQPLKILGHPDLSKDLPHTMYYEQIFKRLSLVWRWKIRVTIVTQPIAVKKLVGSILMQAS